jgi:hypothetical protein
MLSRLVLVLLVLCAALTGCARNVKDPEADVYFWQMREVIESFKKYLSENPSTQGGAFVDMSEWLCPIVRTELLERLHKTGDYSLEQRDVSKEKPNYLAPADTLWILTGNRLDLFSVEKIRITTGTNYCTAHLGLDLAGCC